ncbi:hypothetical protein LJB42_001549 [Komagataella kurtzmanii]|nr:hypothetical protein LJB42_001549 [Komagataella kurtzmanii]
MKLSATLLLSVFTSIQSAYAACDFVGGNYYCNKVSGISYQGIGYSGSYGDVVSMDESSCKCVQQDVQVSGELAPLDEELSVHFRGPIRLSQFGVYYPSSQKKKREVEEECATQKHYHHKHKRAAAVQTVQVTATVTVGDGAGQGSTAHQPATSAQSQAPAGSSVASSIVSSGASAPSSSSVPSTGSWSRSGYYKPGSVDNLTFLNSLGGKTSSGVWSSCFGNSLSYCAANGVDASDTPQALNDVTFKSNTEFVIFSGEACGDSSATGDCGYYRKGIPAYHGFGGTSKIFVFEFTMPSDTGSGAVINDDMPAIWLLNARIPRTLQYGDSSCSCWSTGCGELDLFEILSSGSDKLISHLHSGQGNDGSSRGGGGTQDYIARPTSSSLKAAVIFDGGNVDIVVLDDDTTFGSSLDDATLTLWKSKIQSTASI